MRHKRCNKCGKIGHKPEMVKHIHYSDLGNVFVNYYDPRCYAKKFKVKFVYSLSEGKYVWVSIDKESKTLKEPVNKEELKETVIGIIHLALKTNGKIRALLKEGGRR